PTPPPPSAAAERAAAVAERAAAAERQRQEAEDHAREQRRRDAEQQEAARRAAERAAAEQAAVQKAQALAESAAKLKAQQAAADKARREAELRAQLASEERINAARGSAEMASYLALITGRINRAWIRPSSVRAGLSCILHVTQVPGGEVTGVQIVSCNGDQAARESIEAAVYRASPLPTPSNPDLFDRNLTIRFHPDE
ncbi:MAG: cell envelope integrity protein TolA, partial [Steroidobacteraceae bacterium]